MRQRRQRLVFRLKLGSFTLEVLLEPIIVGRLGAACGSKHLYLALA